MRRFEEETTCILAAIGGQSVCYLSCFSALLSLNFGANNTRITIKTLTKLPLKHELNGHFHLCMMRVQNTASITVVRTPIKGLAE